MELMHADSETSETRDTLLLFGGAALVLLGSGLILSNPVVKKYLGGMNVSSLLQAAAPDFQRYLKLKAM